MSKTELCKFTKIYYAIKIKSIQIDHSRCNRFCLFHLHFTCSWMALSFLSTRSIAKLNEKIESEANSESEPNIFVTPTGKVISLIPRWNGSVFLDFCFYLFMATKVSASQHVVYYFIFDFQPFWSYRFDRRCHNFDISKNRLDLSNRNCTKKWNRLSRQFHTSNQL